MDCSNQFPGRIVPGLIVPYSTVPHQKHDSSATCHMSHFRHIGTLLFSIALTWIAAFIIGITTKCSQSPPPPHATCTPPPQHGFSNPLRFPCPNYYDCLPRPLTSPISPSIAHTLNLACTFTGSGQRSRLGSLYAPTGNSYYHFQLDFTVGYSLPQM